MTTLRLKTIRTERRTPPGIKIAFTILLPKIKHDQEPAAFEGLPHQEFFADEHAAELKTKETVTRHGFAFYKTPIKLKEEDVRKLNALIKHPDAFGPYPIVL